MANDTPLERIRNRVEGLNNYEQRGLSDSDAIKIIGNMVADLAELIEGREQNVDDVIQQVSEQVTDLARPRPFIGPP